MVNLIDYGGGNMGSISRCLNRLDIPFQLATRGSELQKSRPIILPGVGNFGAVMNRLRERELDAAIRDAVLRGTPFLGICVGMQLLFESSEESPLAQGLRLVEGRVKKYNCPKVPQIGWNRLEPKKDNYETGYAYFVNSYYAVPADPSVIMYEAEYGNSFCAAVEKGNITAFQFHPEKSYKFGHGLIRRWADAL